MKLNLPLEPTSGLRLHCPRRGTPEESLGTIHTHSEDTGPPRRIKAGMYVKGNPVRCHPRRCHVMLEEELTGNSLPHKLCQASSFLALAAVWHYCVWNISRGRLLGGRTKRLRLRLCPGDRAQELLSPGQWESGRGGRPSLSLWLMFARPVMANQ